MKTKTAPYLQNAFIKHLKQWHKGRSFHINTRRVSLHRAIDHQNLIGWGWVPLGLISPLWNEVQLSFHQETNKRYALGKRWTTELIKKCWLISWDMWEHRNKILHGNAASAANTEKKKAIDLQVTQELDKGISQLDSFAVNLFNRTATSILNQSYKRKRNWVHTITVARKQTNKRRRVNHGETGLFRFFQPLNSVDTNEFNLNLTIGRILVQYNLLVMLVTGAFQPFGIACSVELIRL